MYFQIFVSTKKCLVSPPILLKCLFNKNAFANLVKANFILVDHGTQAIILDVQQLKEHKNQIKNRNRHMDMFSRLCNGSLICALKVPLSCCEVLKDICCSLHNSFCIFAGRIIPNIKREAPDKQIKLQ